MRMEILEVTPQQAEHWLASAAGIPQRAITPRRVSAFAGAMARGQWKITHQSIAIDPDGILIDGQHRLSAVVMAGVPVPMMIAYDVPREAFDVIDTGFARSTSSALHIAGWTDSNVTAAASRAVLMYDVITGTRRAPSGEIRSAITTRDVLDFLDTPRGENLRGNLTPARGIAVSLARIGVRSWMTAALTLLDDSGADLQLKTEFVDKMHTGAMLAESSPILRFRRWLLSDTGYDRSDRSYRAHIGMAVTVKTWNAWTQGRDLAQMRFMVGREVWPRVGDMPEAHAEREAEREALFALDAEALAAEERERMTA